MKSLPVPLSHLLQQTRQDAQAPMKDTGHESFAPHVEPHVSLRTKEGASVDRGAPGVGDAQPGKPIYTLATDTVQARITDSLPLAISSPASESHSTIYPLTLAVVGYLSMLADVPVDETPPLQQAKTLPVTGEAHFATNVMPGVAEKPTPSVRAEDDVRGTPVERPVENVGDALDAEVPLSAVAGYPESSVPWMKRRIALTESAEGTTLRIRDYAMSPSDAESVVHALRGRIHDAGSTLSRVVVNGRHIDDKE